CPSPSETTLPSDSKFETVGAGTRRFGLQSPRGRVAGALSQTNPPRQTLPATVGVHARPWPAVRQSACVVQGARHRLMVEWLPMSAQTEPAGQLALVTQLLVQ